jgi:hypothetical protein
VSSYAWEWGAKGVCCSEHQFTLQQTAENLSRKINFAPIQQPQAKLTRDERTQLIAARMSAEAELEEAKGRGLDLYRENVQLAKQVQSLTVREREQRVQLNQALADAAELREQLNVKDAENAELTQEVGRLRAIAKFIDEETAPPATRGRAEQPTTVVDG